MDFSSVRPSPVTQNERERTPRCQAEADSLNLMLREFSRENLESLMKISPAIAGETHHSIQQFGYGPAKEALFAYSGTTFQHLNPQGLSAEALDYAQRRLRILSGQYGMLRPFDRIEAYRLEMKTPLAVEGGQKLTAFWKKRISSLLLEEEVLQGEDSVILSLASGEYLAAVDKKKLKRRVINLHFKEEKNGKVRTVGMYVKMARGKMLRRILSEAVSRAEDVRDLSVDGYVYTAEYGDEENWVFARRIE